MAKVQTATESIVESLRSGGADVKYVLEENTTHFNPIIPRIELALNFLLQPLYS